MITTSRRAARAALLAGGMLALAAPAGARPQGPVQLEGSPAIVRLGAFGSDLAKTDASLLKLRGSGMVGVVVKLDYSATAVYRGTRRGYPATSPALTRKPLNPRSKSYRRYQGLQRSMEARFSRRCGRRSRPPGSGAGFAWSTAVSHFECPRSEVGRLLSLPGVKAVQRDDVRHLLTDASPAFVGATALYSSLGGQSRAGDGVIFADLDTGIWPEHPSFADTRRLADPPAARRRRTTRPATSATTR